MSNQIMITLNKIREHHPCTDSWEKVLKANGGADADYNKEFPVSSILQSNSLDDTLWVLRCLPEYNTLWRNFAKWCALQNIEKIKPYCSESDYCTILNYLESAESAESVELAARLAAESAELAARLAAESAELAAESAARLAAESAAAESAAELARLAARAAQEEKLKAVLDCGHWVE